jgi:hypothetical protein
MRRKKGRQAPIIQEQARQGLATKMVASQKEAAQREEEWQFQKSSKEQELANQKKNLKLQQEQAEWNKWMSIGNLALGGLSTAAAIVDAFNLFG